MYFLKNVFKGILIGVANVIPGLSGATIALILRIYEKLIHAISRFNKEVFKNIYKLKFKKVSLLEKLKFENVTGNNNKAEAKIAGITPA